MQSIRRKGEENVIGILDAVQWPVCWNCTRERVGWQFQNTTTTRLTHLKLRNTRKRKCRSWNCTGTKLKHYF